MLKKYISASFLTTITLVITKIIEFILIAVLTRIISVDEYGKYSLFTSWVSILSIIIGGSLGSSFGIAKKDFKTKYPQYLASCVGLSYIFLIIGFCAGFIINRSWSVLYLCLVLMHSFNTNIMTNYDVILIFNFKFVKSAFVNLLKSIASFAVIIIAVLLFRNVNSGTIAIMALFSVYFMISIYCQIDIFIENKCFCNKEYWIYAIKNSFWMISHNLSLVILNQMDRIMIGNLLQESYVAIYSVIYGLSVVISILWTGFHKVWMAWLYEKLTNDKLIQVINMNNLICYVMGFLTINYCYITPEIIKIFLPVTYWDGIDIMPAILFGYFFSFIFSIYVNIEYFYKRMKMITLGTILSALTNIFANYLFIPIYGYKISAYTTLLAYFVLFSYHYVFNIKKKIFDDKQLWFVVSIMAIMLYLCKIFSDLLIIRASILILFDIIIIAFFYIRFVQGKITIRELLQEALRIIKKPKNS